MTNPGAEARFARSSALRRSHWVVAVTACFVLPGHGAAQFDDEPHGASRLIRVIDSGGRGVPHARVFVGSDLQQVDAPNLNGSQGAFDLIGIAYMLGMVGGDGLAVVLDGGALKAAGETDESGVAALNPPVDARAIVWIEKHSVGSSGLHDLGPETEAAEGPLVLTLRPRGELHGILVDDARRPLPSRRLALVLARGAADRGPRQPGEVVTNADGEFSVSVDAPAEGRLFMKSDVGWFHVREVVFHPGEATELAIVLPRVVKLVGTVVDEAGQPVTDGLVRSFPWWEAPAASTKIGADGSFTLKVAGLGRPFEYEAVGPGFMTPGALSCDAKASVESVTVRVSRGRELHGVVVDEQGRPIEGAEVDGRTEDDEPTTVMLRSIWGLEGYKSTDGAGRFAYGSLVPGCRYRLWAEAIGFDRAELADALAGGPDVTITLRRR